MAQNAEDEPRRARLLRELNAVLHALHRAEDPRTRLMFSSARVYLENELDKLDRSSPAGHSTVPRPN